MTPTRKVSAVKRKAPAVQRPKVEGVLEPVHKLSVLRRGGLLNAAGDEDDGWKVRSEDGEDVLHFVPADEPMLTSIARGFGKEADHFFDVMRGRESLACAVLHGKATLMRGSGELLDGNTEELATLHLGRSLWAQCVPGANPTPLLTVKPERRGGAHAMARARLVALVEQRQSGGMFTKLEGYDVSFQNDATPFEKLLLVTAVFMSDAFEIRANYRRSRNDRGEGISFWAGASDD
jgi:hypothetical protein